MSYTKKNRRNQIWALTLSIALHSILLLGAYYFLFKPYSLPRINAYRVRLFPATAQEKNLPVHQEVKSKQRKEKPSEQPITTSPKSNIATKNSPAYQPQESSTHLEKPTQPVHPEPKIPIDEQVETPAEQAPIQPAIDERSLYQASLDKKTGASLELVGWVWDMIPQPPDTTSETGKLVFEIIIDNIGEIIAVKTLEKTVSPLVEQLYKDTVAKLTFSRTTENKAYTPRSVGKVTFIIKAK